MGGNGGEVHSSCLTFSDDYSKHPDDYYSTTSCVNCHQSPPKITSLDPVCDGYLPRPSPCPAEIRWPEYLQSNIRDIESYSWWVSQNYLSTKMAKDEFPVTPKKLDLGVVFYLKPDQKIPISGTGLELHSEDPSLISSTFVTTGQGKSLSILLENQNLFLIKNLSAHLASGWDILVPRNTLETVSVRDGQLLLTAAYGYRNLFRSKSNPLLSERDITVQILPLLPVAYHEVTGKTLTLAEFEPLSPKERRNYHRFEILYEAARTKRFPERLRIQEIYQLVQDFQISSEKAQKNGAPPPDLAKLGALLSSIWVSVGIVPEEVNTRNLFARFRDVPNSNAIQMSLKTDGIQGLKSAEASGGLNLEELFVPALIHLGPTTADFKLQIDPQGKSHIDLTQINSEIKPIDYFKTSPRKLGVLEIKGGSIKDGAPITYNGIQFTPGIHIESQKPREYSIQANLNLNLKLLLPVIGEVEITSPFLFQTTLNQFEETEKDALGNPRQVTKFYIAPQTTLMAFPSLELKWGGLIPQVVKGSLVIADRTLSSPGTLLTAPADGFWLGFEAKDISRGPLQNGKWEVSLPLPRNSNGFYDLESFQKTPELVTALLFNRKDKTQLKGNAALKTTSKGPQTDYRLDISLDQLDELGVKVIDPWVKDGILTVSAKANSNKSNSYETNFSAKSLWLEPYDVGIHSPKFRFFFTENRIENQMFDWTIHDFQFSGNPPSEKFPTRGIFRGPILLRTYSVPGKELVFQSDQNAHELRVKHLSLGFDFKQMALPGLKNLSDGKISGIDVDGRVAGHWKMDTESYKGNGQIIIRGDKEGDIHLRDSKGRRIEARLNPKDPDRLYEVPLLADSTWKIDRIDGVDTARERINGHFVLKTLIDYMVLQVIGINWNQHDEVTFEYDHQPYSARGFDLKIAEFFQQIAEEEKKAAKAKGATP